MRRLGRDRARRAPALCQPPPPRPRQLSRRGRLRPRLPGRRQIGARTLVMHGAVLHVYNFRDLPHAGIRIGRDASDRRVHRHPRPGRGHHRRPRLHLADDPDHRRQPRLRRSRIGPSSSRASPPRASSSRTMSGSAPAPSSPTASASAAARWSPPARWSPATCPPTPWSPACRRASSARSAKLSAAERGRSDEAARKCDCFRDGAG